MEADSWPARGDPVVHDVVGAPGGASNASVRLGRHVGAFFQGNRYLLQTLVDRVLTFVPDGPLCDLYAGSGLFGVTYAATGRGEVDAVESDALAADDLRVNATPYAETRARPSARRSNDFWPRAARSTAAR